MRWPGRRGGAPGGAALGRSGERVAARWLRRRGYRLLERNLAVGRDEADLVAIAPDGRTLVIVEVKARRGANWAPEDRIDRGKCYRLARLAARLQRRPAHADRPVRFDAIAVTWPAGSRPQVRHYVGAFESPV